MTDKNDLSEIEEIIRLGLREQANHPEGLNSSITHGTLYPASDPRNKTTSIDNEPKLEKSASGTSKPLRVDLRRNWR